MKVDVPVRQQYGHRRTTVGSRQKNKQHNPPKVTPTRERELMKPKAQRQQLRNQIGQLQARLDLLQKTQKSYATLLK